MRRLLLGILLLLSLATLSFTQILQWWEAPLHIPEGGYRLTVAEGDTLRRVTERLAADGVLAHPELLILYGRISGLDLQIKRGEYRLPEYLTALSLLHLLRAGEVVQYLVTLPEGITLRQALAILREAQGLRASLSGPEDPALLALAAPYDSAEGLFFPDSYRYTRGDSDLDILRRAHRVMQTLLEEEWAAREEGLPYATPYEALIMASIIERETGAPEEREQIAGVFVRRLHKGMRLQTDPTVIYGLGTAYDGNLTRSHLRDDANVYNTYRHSGLPPTPIALAGSAALRAALHPAHGNALYFVARGDGGHVFSATLAEHQKAVRKYQLQRRKDYRSSPGSK
ncbi:MAG: endolytic transglycosylase MltG [Halioglobus sp.]